MRGNYGKQIIIPSVHSNTYYHRDIELSVLRAYDIYNRNPQKFPNKQSFKTMPSMYSNLYHLQRPTKITQVGEIVKHILSIAETKHRARHITTAKLNSTGDILSARTPLFFNSDIIISVAAVSENMDYWYRNGSADEVLFVQSGKGKLISNLGYEICLSDYVVENIVEEDSFKNLILHELRWARTLRRVEPLGYALTFLTDSLILSFILSFILYLETKIIILCFLPILLTFMLQVLLHNSSNEINNSKNAPEIWLIPLRNVLSFCIRVISYTGNLVKWRNNTFSVDHLGLIHEKQTVALRNTDNSGKITESVTSEDF